MRLRKPSATRASVTALPSGDPAGPTGFDALLALPTTSGTEAGTAGTTAGAAAGTAAASAPIRSRLSRLAGGVDRTGRRKAAGRDVQKIMNLLGVLVIGIGIAAVVLGWYGASHSPYLYQEVPYLISGGLLGVALVVAGGAVFIGSWLLRQVQETRRDTQVVVRSIERLERAVREARPVAPEPVAGNGGNGGNGVAGGAAERTVASGAR